ncbi:Nat4p [Saccharomyces cerevisiae x Saccharomyces kudriavzevii VIN7]|uniref:N-alpha-acetyltransferase 40 n=1 Tax=Saccharomyces cerevisiae x Saccharomyces kudriavzevii (strain VIN7) TaxID=1095631 RepID=H0GZA5_SACCK|nr:Nat4p [Saccharomyces cerevisiae x Saccharomyces kudriavzevii VIN7]
MFKKFLSICIDEFPETLEYTESNENATVVTTTVLKREIMCIPEENGEVDSIDGPQCTNYNLHKSHGDHVLDSCVQLVDEHLGDKYRRASRTIYGNRIPWKTNKLAEMKSAGLLYVSYWGNGALGAFASFMLTEETGLVEGDAAHEVSVPVIYLYEIHVAHAHRGHGLGRRLLERALCEGVARRVRRVRCDFFGVALTVFGDNTRARRLYEAIGFCRAPGSPAPAAPALRPTRHGRKRVVVARDPLYYVYCLHMP